jgi:hypothetical protein
MHDVPSIVLAFVGDYLTSVTELQLLLTCMQSGDRWWDARSAAREMGISETAARRALDRLVARNLFDIKVTGDVRYQFRPGTPDLAACAQALAEAYRANPVSIINRLAPSTRQSLRDFADAFRIRKDDDR